MFRSFRVVLVNIRCYIKTLEINDGKIIALGIGVWQLNVVKTSTMSAKLNYSCNFDYSINDSVKDYNIFI